jgi:hypothetical protein
MKRLETPTGETVTFASVFICGTPRSCAFEACCGLPPRTDRESVTYSQHRVAERLPSARMPAHVR